MGCNCLNKKKLDIDYIKKLANAFSVSMKVDVQIYEFYLGNTKYYDFEELPTRTNHSVVETIRFSEPESLDILPTIEFTGFDIIDSEVRTANSEFNTIPGNSESNSQSGYLDKKTVKKGKDTKSTKRTVTKPIDSDSGTVL